MPRIRGESFHREKSSSFRLAMYSSDGRFERIEFCQNGKALSYSTVMSWTKGTRENSATAAAIMIFSVMVSSHTKCRVSFLNSMDARGSTIT